MIKRLQIEPPTPKALPADKSEQSRDSTDQESISSEFKKLLEKARGGIAGARDEVVALGMALSQAVSMVRTQHADIKRSETTVDHSEGDAQVETAPVDQPLDQSKGLNTEERREVASDSKEDTCSIEVEEDQSLGEDTGPVQVDEGVDQGEEIALEEDVVFTDTSDFAEGPATTTDQDTGIDLSQVVNRSTDLDVSNTIQVAQGDIQKKVDVLRRVELGSVMKDDGDDDGSLEEVDTSSPQQPGIPLQNADFRGFKGDSVVKESVASLDAVEEAPQVNTLPGAALQPASDGQDAGESRLDASAGGSRANSWSDQSNRPLKLETRFELPQNEVAVTQPVKEQNADLSIQLTLLRQAFESLKAQGQGQSDMKPKSSAAPIGAVGGAAEPKAAQNDSAPRAMRYLNRATTARMMERIESALKEAARSRDGKTISLHLEPVQLGRVKVDVSLRDGALHARVTPQSQEVLHALREHSHELQSALRRLGLNVERVTVQVTSDTSAPTFSNDMSSFEGKSFQQERNNMPSDGSQVPENTFGNEFADVSTAGLPVPSAVPVDHLIA